MALIPMSADSGLHNMASVQHRGEVHFLATRNIRQGEVLKVQYGAKLTKTKAFSGSDNEQSIEDGKSAFHHHWLEGGLNNVVSALVQIGNPSDVRDNSDGLYAKAGTSSLQGKFGRRGAQTGSLQQRAPLTSHERDSDVHRESDVFDEKATRSQITTLMNTLTEGMNMDDGLCTAPTEPSLSQESDEIQGVVMMKAEDLKLQTVAESLSSLDRMTECGRQEGHNSSDTEIYEPGPRSGISSDEDLYSENGDCINTYESSQSIDKIGVKQDVINWGNVSRTGACITNVIKPRSKEVVTTKMRGWNPPGRTGSDKSKCPLCQSMFIDLKHHLMEEHCLSQEAAMNLLVSSYNCLFCDESYSTPSALGEHMVQMHNSQAIDPLKCCKCQERFETFSSLQRHELSHASLMTVVCHQCGRRVLKTDIEEHLSREHPQDSGYSCDWCGRVLTSFEDLTQHIQVAECLEKQEREKRRGRRKDCHFEDGEVEAKKFRTKRKNKSRRQTGEMDNRKGRNVCEDDTGVPEFGGKKIGGEMMEMKYAPGKRSRTKNSLGEVVNGKVSMGKSLRIGKRSSFNDEKQMVDLNAGRERPSRNLMEELRLDTSVNEFASGVVSKVEASTSQGTVGLHLNSSKQTDYIDRRGNQTQKGKKIQCKICDFGSSSMFCLQEHVLNDHDGVSTGIPEQFQHCCSDCGRIFLRLGRLTRHMQSHGPKQFSCGICKHTFARREGPNLHKCNDSKSVSRDHKSDKTAPNPHICRVCSRSFAQLKVLTIHLHSHFRNIPDGLGMTMLVQAPAICEGGLSCLHCHFQFSHISSFIQHHRRVHKVETHLCGICHKCFSSHNLLVSHMADHTDRAVLPGDLKSTLGNFLTCEHCFAIFPNASTLGRHTAIHRGRKEFICDRCGRMFTRKDALVAHARVHGGLSELYQCVICCKSMKSQRALRVHLGIHRKEREYHCHVCSRGFKQQGNLNKHLTKCGNKMTKNV